MKKLLQSILFIWICTVLPNFVSAQEIIVEQIKTIQESPLKFKHNFPKEEYTKIADKNGQKTYVLNKSLPQNNISNLINNVSFNINLVFDSEQYEPSTIIIYNEEGYRSSSSWNGQSPITVNVPIGIYDLFVHFNRIDGTDYIVIKEKINIEESQSLNIDVSEAKNHITSELLNENGALLRPGVLDTNSGTITGGNAEPIADRIFYFNPTNTRIADFGFLWSYKQSEEEAPIWNFYINNISERYTIAQNIFAVGHEGDNYFSKYPLLTGVSGSVDLENNPEDYVFHLEKFQPSVLGESTETFYTSISTYNTWQGVSRGGWGIGREIAINPEEGFRAYLNNPFNENPYDLLVFPGIIDYKGTMNPNLGDEGFIIEGTCIFAEENGGVLYGSGAEIAGSSYFLGNQYYNVGNFNTGIGYSQFLPFHERFTFNSSENPDMIQGNNIPISVIGTMMLPQYGMNYLQGNYKGRYGETRETDFFNTTVEAKQNGTVVFTGKYVDFKDLLPLPADGVWDITYTNNNIEIEGIPGKNITHIVYEGEAPPTLQHMQFRNAYGKVTDHFESTQEGTVRLAAGDFEFDADASVFAYKEGSSVEFFYSLHNQNNWTELELTEYPEYFQMPAFGDYYEASLANVIVPDQNTWFDVRIVCTDAVGNKQEQIISPAFKVEQATLGVEDISNYNLVIYPNPVDEILNISHLKEISNIWIYDVSGKQVYTENSNNKKAKIDVSYLSPGIYIVKAKVQGVIKTFKIVKR